MRQKQTGQLAREYLTKFPKSSILQLAKKLKEDYPAQFSSVEHARSLLRANINKSGKGRVSVKNPIKRETLHTRENPYGLPEPECKGKQTFKLPSNCTDVLWLSDIHFPNQDNIALTAALNYGKANNINCIVLGGDILDNTPFTAHFSPPANRSDAKRYFDMCGAFLDTLKKEFNCPIYWIEGNHDKWYERFLIANAPQIWDDEYFSIESRLGLKQKGITYLKDNVILKAGKLDMLHGHTIVRGFLPPVNPARGVFMRAKSSAIIGHCHQTSEHSESNLKGELTTCYSTGCLCDLNPEFDPHNTKHNHGFAHIKIQSNGHYQVLNKRIIKGEVI